MEQSVRAQEDASRLLQTEYKEELLSFLDTLVVVNKWIYEAKYI